MNLRYPVTLTPAHEGGFIICVDDVPEAIAEGDDVDEALANAAKILGAVLEFYVDDGEDLPTPSVPAEGQYTVCPVGFGAAR